MHTSVERAQEPAVDVKLSLVFPREALSVPVMRHMLGDALRGLGADDDGLAELLLAVTEACTNVVRHGGPGRRYEVVASLGRRGCRIEVQNSWPGFALRRLPGLRRRPWTAPSATALSRRRGGRPANFGRSLLGAPWAGNGAGKDAKTAGDKGAMAASDDAAKAARDEEIAALPESGRGIEIMRAWTVVSLQKRLAWRPGAPFAETPAGEAGMPAGEFADAG